MGLLEILARIFGLHKKTARIIFLGLDNSGKSTILQHLKPADMRNERIVPTLGFSTESFTTKLFSFTAFDMSGQSVYRSLWEKYYADVSGIVFVIDSTDGLRLSVAQDELNKMLTHANIAEKNIPILFYGNKMDLPGANSPQYITEQMKLYEINDKPWRICASNALSGEGLSAGIDWLGNQILHYHESK
ncbi:hypothetical protein SNEBB_010450 [Seison nebaliae]|nr:hypothetical protein SNEBB_010450 [Seison nebaliae]